LTVLKGRVSCSQTKILVEIQRKFSQIVFPKSGDLFFFKNKGIIPYYLGSCDTNYINGIIFSKKKENFKDRK
jgi:hypothetical protein